MSYNPLHRAGLATLPFVSGSGSSQDGSVCLISAGYLLHANERGEEVNYGNFRDDFQGLCPVVRALGIFGNDRLFPLGASNARRDWALKLVHHLRGSLSASHVTSQRASKAVLSLLEAYTRVIFGDTVGTFGTITGISQKLTALRDNYAASSAQLFPTTAPFGRVFLDAVIPAIQNFEVSVLNASRGTYGSTSQLTDSFGNVLQVFGRLFGSQANRDYSLTDSQFAAFRNTLFVVITTQLHTILNTPYASQPQASDRRW